MSVTSANMARNGELRRRRQAGTAIFRYSLLFTLGKLDYRPRA